MQRNFGAAGQRGRVSWGKVGREEGMGDTAARRPKVSGVSSRRKGQTNLFLGVEDAVNIEKDELHPNGLPVPVALLLDKGRNTLLTELGGVILLDVVQRYLQVEAWRRNQGREGVERVRYMWSKRTRNGGRGRQVGGGGSQGIGNSDHSYTSTAPFHRYRVLVDHGMARGHLHELWRRH